MIDRDFHTSPQTYARIGGALYLSIIILGVFAEGWVTSTLIVAGDPAATASNIVRSSSLWQLGVAANVFIPICAVPLLLIEYLLLRPVSRHLALLAVLFNLVSLALEAVSKVDLLVVTSLLTGSAASASTFEPQQLQTLAHLAYQSHNAAWNLALMFFGFTCLVNGYLISKSTYLPKTVGVLLQLAGASYLIACFSIFFAPPVADRILPTILLIPFVGELSFCLWLLVKGVDVHNWRAACARENDARSMRS